MAVMRFMLLAFMVVGAEAGACTPVDSCPKLSDGLYCPVNDVTEHADINRDVKLIKDYLAETPLNYAMAKQVYTACRDGRHSSSLCLGRRRCLLHRQYRSSNWRWLHRFCPGQPLLSLRVQLEARHRLPRWHLDTHGGRADSELRPHQPAWRCLQCCQCESSRISHVQDLLHCCHPKCHQVRMEGLQWWHHGAKVPRRGLGLLEECLRLHVHLQCHHRAGGGCAL